MSPTAVAKRAATVQARIDTFTLRVKRPPPPSPENKAIEILIQCQYRYGSAQRIAMLMLGEADSRARESYWKAVVDALQVMSDNA